MKTKEVALTYSKAKSSEKYLPVNIDGNKKLVNNDSVRFIIWNLPSIITCPYATDHCKCLCYAKKAETAYPTCLPSRQRNFELAESADFVENMIFTIDTELKTKKFTGKKVVFRIHESGDFYSKEYVNKWLQIAAYFDYFYHDRIVFMAYTKSLEFFKGEYIPENMVVRASVWDDSKPEFLELVKHGNYPIYTAVETFDGYTGIKCRCEDCASCGLCWNRKAQHIACEIH